MVCVSKGAAAVNLLVLPPSLPSPIVLRIPHSAVLVRGPCSKARVGFSYSDQTLYLDQGRAKPVLHGPNSTASNVPSWTNHIQGWVNVRKSYSCLRAGNSGPCCDHVYSAKNSRPICTAQLDRLVCLIKRLYESRVALRA